MTATPCRRDSRGLGNTFGAMVEAPQVDQLIEMGFLVPTEVYVPSTPDLSGVHTRKGDYVESELADRVDRPQLVGDIVTHWLRLADRRRTIVFATSVGHSRHIEDEMRRADIKVAHIDGATPKDERDDILGQLAAGDIEVVTNCMVLTEGYNLPDIGCIVLARPTKSMGLYRQMAGRGIRPAPGKQNCLILDHAGATFQHGRVEDPVIWTLDEDTKAESPAQFARGFSPERELTSCSQCSAIRTAGRPCPSCGFMPKRPAKYLEVFDGELARLDRNGRIDPNTATADEKHDWHRQLVHIANGRNYKLGWVAHKFREKFGHFPSQRYVPPMEPTAEVIAWERSRRIAWAKAQQKPQGLNA